MVSFPFLFWRVGQMKGLHPLHTSLSSAAPTSPNRPPPTLY